MSPLVTYFRKAGMAIAATALLSSALGGPAYADRISNPVAEFNGLDKITGRITSFDVYIGETVQFGALQVTPRVCYSRDDKETQRVDSFVEVEEITLDRKIRRIFTGWMFADSPGLNAVEHPIYDVWLKACKLESDVPPPEGLALPDPTPQPDPELNRPPVTADTSNTDNADTTGNTGDAAAANDSTVGNLAGTEDAPPLEDGGIVGDQLLDDGTLQSGQDLFGDNDLRTGESPEFDNVPSLKDVKPGTGLF